MSRNFLFDFLPDELIDEIFFIIHKEKFKESLDQINEEYVNKFQIRKFIDTIIQGVLDRLNNN
jgi:hypothetical protein